MSKFVDGTTLAALIDAARHVRDSAQRFEDGGECRVEIPSVESPTAFREIVEAAAEQEVPLHRISQGSGVSMLLDHEIQEYVQIGADHRIEVCLFVGPRAPWNASASALTPDGKYFGWRHMTVDTLRAAYDDVVRAGELGIRSILVADEGLVTLIEAGKHTGEVPSDMVVKVSAVMGIANPLGARLLVEHGVDSVNVAGDTPVAELAAFRAAFTAALDIYVEGPDGLGGFLRYHDIGEIVRVAAPVYLKFGLRNAPGIYPSGQHLDTATRRSGVERVRRAATGLEHLARQRPASVFSPLGETDRGIPVPKSHSQVPA